MCSASQPWSRAMVAGDAQREALLAEQRVAAVAGADAPDRVLLGEVHDEAALRARGRRASAGPGTKSSRAAELVEGGLAHARHDAHVGDDVGAVGDLDADLAERRAERAHDVRHDVHRPALHRARRRAGPTLARAPPAGAIQLLVGPASSRARLADEREVLGARDVVGVAAVQVAARGVLRVEALERAVREHVLDEAVRSRPPSRRTRPPGPDAASSPPRRPSARQASCSHYPKARRDPPYVNGGHEENILAAHPRGRRVDP